MKKLLRQPRELITPLFLSLFALASAKGQVTISASDLSPQIAPGVTITSRQDTSTKMINIGTPGATSWDFSTLTTDFTSQATFVRPDTTPYFSYFAGATNAERVSLGGLGTIYSYMQLGTDLLLRGSAISGTFQQRTIDAPSEILYKLPLTMGASWTTVYAETSIVVLPPPLPPTTTVTTHSLTNSVDAYGSLTLPGGGVYQALRLKTDSRIATATSHSRSIWYTILAPNGATAVVVAADTLQPDFGVIKVSNISRTNPLTTDVAIAPTTPSTYALNQNYPNPFNPTTAVSFQLPAVSDVRLVVYDLLGREVAVLVNEKRPAGRYEASFDASGLSSGIYFYRLTAGPYAESRRMVLMK